MMKKIAPPYGLAVNEVRTKSMTDQGSNPNGGQKNRWFFPICEGLGR